MVHPAESAWLLKMIEHPVLIAKMLLLSQRRKEGILAVLPMGLVVVIAKLVWINHFVITSRFFRDQLRESVWTRELWNILPISTCSFTFAERNAWFRSFQKAALIRKRFPFDSSREYLWRHFTTSDSSAFFFLESGYFWNSDSYVIELDSGETLPFARHRLTTSWRSALKSLAVDDNDFSDVFDSTVS
jgi:hypothetical protein